MKKKPNTPKRVAGVVIVSDLHCGSSVGLWPDGCETDTGNFVQIGNNLHQKWLWQCWQDAVQRTIAHFNGRPFYLICNGDLIEGRHHGTTEIVVSKNMEHAAGAVVALEPLARAASRRFFTAGTECHVGDYEKFICKELKGEWCGDKALIEVNGTLLDIAHHMPTAGRAYLEAGAMSITMGNARQNYARSGHRVPKVYARGHRHVGGHFSDGRGLFVVTPAWQVLTRYGHKVVGDSICSCGMTLLDWSVTPDGEIPAVIPLTYTPNETQPIRA
jgi:hypothetical protein